MGPGCAQQREGLGYGVWQSQPRLCVIIQLRLVKSDGADFANWLPTVPLMLARGTEVDGPPRQINLSKSAILLREGYLILDEEFGANAVV